MSTGRKTLRLEDLAGAHLTLAPEVAVVEVVDEHVADVTLPNVTPALADVTADALESGLGEWSSGLPADWQFRTTDEDVRELAG